MTQTVLRVNSHRAGSKLHNALGYTPQYYYTWEQGGCFVVLSKETVDQVLPITGITRSRVQLNDLAMCWKSSSPRHTEGLS